jgi:glycosyltransferase involved in cell wall biosynthesis
VVLPQDKSHRTGKFGYCGEPAVAECESCVAGAGVTNGEDIAPRALRERSAAELAGASRVVVPSRDVSVRIRRHFPHLKTETEAWEDDAGMRIPESRGAPGGDAVVCVAGAIGIEKGYGYLLACARDAAARRLALRFAVVGYTCGDAGLLETGSAFVTGHYREEEAVDLVRSQQADLGFLPSLWPETWCYALTNMWRAGLPVVAFDIGAQAERIRLTGRGRLLPLGIPPSRMNDTLLELASARRAGG